MQIRPFGLVLLAAFALSSIPAPTAQACLHPAGTRAKRVTQSGQQALILHDGETEDLVLRVDYQGLRAPSLAWVLPVPAVPTAYEAMEPGLFEALGEWIDLRREPAQRPRAKGTVASAPRPSTLTLLPPVSVGPFEIQPIRAQGTAAASELEAWMTEHGFTAIPTEALQYYVDRSWTFLAVKIDPAPDESFDRKGGLPPLRVTFPSKDVVYPLKLSTHMGRFTARVHVVTARSLPPDAAEALATKGFETVIDGASYTLPQRPATRLHSAVGLFSPSAVPETLRPLVEARFPDEPSLHMAVLLSERVNDPSTAQTTLQGQSVVFEPARWDEDVIIGLPPAPPPAPPTSAKPNPEPETPKTDDSSPVEGSTPPDDDPRSADGEPKPRRSGAARGCGCHHDPGLGPLGGLGLLSLLLGGVRRRRNDDDRSS